MLSGILLCSVLFDAHLRLSGHVAHLLIIGLQLRECKLFRLPLGLHLHKALLDLRFFSTRYTVKRDQPMSLSSGSQTPTLTS